MDTSPELLEKAFTAKEARRRALARASFEEKIGILIRLQEMAAAIAKTRGQVLRPWMGPGFESCKSGSKPH